MKKDHSKGDPLLLLIFKHMWLVLTKNDYEKENFEKFVFPFPENFQGCNSALAYYYHNKSTILNVTDTND